MTDKISAALLYGLNANPSPNYNPISNPTPTNPDNDALLQSTTSIPANTSQQDPQDSSPNSIPTQLQAGEVGTYPTSHPPQTTSSAQLPPTNNSFLPLLASLDCEGTSSTLFSDEDLTLLARSRPGLKIVTKARTSWARNTDD